MKKIIYLISIMLAGWGIALASEKSGEEPLEVATKHYPVQVENRNTQRQIVQLTFTEKPRRCIAYHQNNIETFIRLQELDRLIAAQGRYVAVTPEEKSLQQRLLPQLHYQGQHGINQEMAIYLQPDLILGWPSSFTSRGAWGLGETDFWQARGVNCYITTQNKPRGEQETMLGELKYLRDMGKIFAQEAVTESYAQELEAYITRIRQEYAGQESQRVLVLDVSGNYLVTYRGDRVVGDIITQLGGAVVATPPFLSKEELLLIDPEVIFLLYKTNESVQVREDFLQERLYQGLQAVRKQRVYPIPMTYIHNSGWRLKDGVQAIAQGLYPQLQKE